MSAYVSAELRRQIREHFKNCCAYCRSAEELTVAIFEIEHIVPRSAGGATLFENLCFACPTCNRYKSDRIVGSDPQSGIEAALFHPQHDHWEDHFSWSDNFSEIVPLTPCGRVTIAALRMNRPQLTRVRQMWVELGEHPPNFD